MQLTALWIRVYMPCEYGGWRGELCCVLNPDIVPCDGIDPVDLDLPGPLSYTTGSYKNHLRRSIPNMTKKKITQHQSCRTATPPATPVIQKGGKGPQEPSGTESANFVSTCTRLNTDIHTFKQSSSRHKTNRHVGNPPPQAHSRWVPISVD